MGQIQTSFFYGHGRPPVKKRYNEKVMGNRKCKKIKGRRSDYMPPPPISVIIDLIND